MYYNYMETLTSSTSVRKSWFNSKMLSLALWAALTFWNISCWNTTQKDVMEKQEKVENLSFQISHYISARKGFVEKYNKLLKYPKNKTNEANINNSLSQLYEVIVDYDEKIADLAEDKIDAEVNLNEDIANLWNWFNLKWPIDPNKRDFLLTIQ